MEFQHTALDDPTKQIRLLQLHPQDGTPDKPLRVSLHAFDLGACPDFVALSYEWGPETPTSSIQLNGGQRNLSIRKNLFQFLNRWVSKADFNPDAFIWIDQLCVDQSSISERNAQVQLMDQFYSKATRVVIWLGEDEVIEKYMRIHPTSYHAQEHEVEVRTFADSKDSSFRRLGDAFEFASYWSRVWIQQEVALARDLIIMSGNEVLELAKCSDRWKRSLFGARALRRWLKRKDTEESSDEEEEDLELFLAEDVLSNAKEWRCTDVRDKVFGLYALTDSGQRIEVDYALSARQVCVAALQKYIEVCLAEDEYPVNIFAMTSFILNMGMSLATKRHDPRKADHDIAKGDGPYRKHLDVAKLQAMDVCWQKLRDTRSENKMRNAFLKETGLSVDADVSTVDDFLRDLVSTASRVFGYKSWETDTKIESGISFSNTFWA